VARTCRKRPRKVELNLLGVYNGARATCSGTVEGASDVKFEATQIYSQENTLAADARCAVAKLKADKLSKGLDSRLRPRHLPAPGPLSSEPMQNYPSNHRQQQIYSSHD